MVSSKETESKDHQLGDKMAGPDKEEPVTNMLDTKEIPAKASPPREKSPSVTETKTSGDGVSGTVPPPDGGWGWAVVFASFMIHIIGNITITQNLDV